MKKRFVAMILITAVLLSAFNFSLNAHAETTSSQSLGSITDCTVDSNRDIIKIRGSVKHSVLIGNRDSRIAVYRFDPWTDVTSAIATAKPEAVTDMSISFNFELPCSTVLQMTSLYAVALINAGGKPSIISSPTYPDVSVKDTSDAGFKTILTSDHAAALQVLPGSAIVDVYLDKLNNGNNSGYIYNADGDLFYFDKTEINGLDRAIRSYTASGTKVYMRFLISPSVTDLAFCSDASTWAANKCVVVDDADALRSIYAYTAFLISRYSGGDYGCVDGIILGRGADMPVLNNYAFLVSENYNTVYARSLTLIGLAAAQSTDNKIALLVPIGDELTSNTRVNGEEFLYAVADYVETYSNLSFTVLCESRHNPYGISDAIFGTNDESEITGEFTETTEIEHTQNCETDSVTEYISDVEASEATQTQEVSAEADMTLTDPQDILTEPASPSIESVPMENLSPEEETSAQDRLQPNKNSQGYFCTDNIEAFQQMFSRLKKKHASVNKAFAWCWYPDTDTAESALGVCYAYNYMKLAAMDADFYAVGFENELVDRFQSVSHL